MPFEIVITETRSIEGVTPRTWQRVTADPDSLYDYTPQVPEVRMENVERLKQTVEDLNFPAVIKAINNL